MPLSVFVTDSCRKDATKYGIIKEVEKLSAKVELDQSIGSWDRYPPPYIKKSLGKTWRLVAEERILDDGQIVIAFVGVKARGSTEYETFKHNPVSVFRSVSPSDDELRKYLQGKKPRRGIPEPSQAEYSYLYGTTASMDLAEGIVFESREWVDRMSSGSLNDLFVRYYDLLSDVIAPSNADKSFVQHSSGVGIVYRYFPNHNVLFLIAPTSSHGQSVEDLGNDYQELLQWGDDVVDLNRIQRMSKRSYPMLIFAHDFRTWIDIQKNKEGNLALSPEEAAILESIRHGGSNSPMYPLFINGRPGSGKSTILQYLFAGRLHLHLRKDQDERLSHPPIYLTYSSKLIQQAKEAVSTILKCNASFVTESVDLSSHEAQAIFASAFSEFHRFLLSLLDPEQRNKFSPADRIDFGRFKREWQKMTRTNPDSSIRKLSAELAWHVIRMYIKGMRDELGDYLDPDAYTELPVAQQTVTEETYRKVFHYAWESWYKRKCDQEGWWDDQDLAHKVLELHVLKEMREARTWWDDQDLAHKVLELPSDQLAQYPAVFCDEAQDFTKLELLLLLRLNLFSRRRIPPADLKRIPFAFAGDPFQTLNPTGFDWGAVQAGFHEKIVKELDKDSRAKLEFNYKELAFNYRSSRHVVGFCNLLQLVRGLIFNIKGLQPQQSWFDEDAPLPMLFDVATASCQREIRRQSELVFILPCQEGEEEDYVQRDDFLRTLEDSSNSNIYLSSVAAKGLEFKRVVLYKFGDDALRSYPRLLEPLETGVPHTVSPETGLPIQYFMNRLFVAASRPMRRLFVVDTADAISKIWNHPGLRSLEKLVNQYNSPNWGVEMLTPLQAGRDQSWSEDKDDPGILAEQLRDSGISDRSSYKLRLAANMFERCGRKAEATECRAMALEIDEQYADAGDLYIKLSEFSKALGCYWKARTTHGYEQILQCKQLSDYPEAAAADFMMSKKSVQQCKSIIDRVHHEVFENNKGSLIIGDMHWASVINKAVQHLSNAQQEVIDWNTVFKQIMKLQGVGVIVDRNDSLATLAFRANQYQMAIDIWEAMQGGRNENLYNEAKAITTPFPQNLSWLLKLAKYQKIIEEWEANMTGAKLTKEQSTIIAKAYLQSKKYDRALGLLRQHPHLDTFKDLLEQVKKEPNREILLEVIELYARSILLNRGFKEALDYLRKLKDREERHRGNLALVEILASSEDLVQASSDIRTNVGSYLREEFIDNQNWGSSFSMPKVGAAIERAGRMIDALEFYESVWKTRKLKVPTQEVEYARRRWLKCKYRYLRYLEERQKHTHEFERHKDEADTFAKQHRIDPQSLPEYPEIPSTDSGFKDIDETRIEAILTLHAQGFSAQKIAQAMGLDEISVVRVLRTSSR
jgi:hypothetical protein